MWFMQNGGEEEEEEKICRQWGDTLMSNNNEI